MNFLQIIKRESNEVINESKRKNQRVWFTKYQQVLVNLDLDLMKKHLQRVR